jgi:hypothetical protein
MKIRPEELDKLSDLLVSVYRDKELIIAKAGDDAIKRKIAAIIAENVAEEEAIEEEARRMLAAHGPAAREMDSYKMYLLAKQKLAAKKGFIL